MCTFYIYFSTRLIECMHVCMVSAGLVAVCIFKRYPQVWWQTVCIRLAPAPGPLQACLARLAKQLLSLLCGKICAFEHLPCGMYAFYVYFGINIQGSVRFNVHFSIRLIERVYFYVYFSIRLIVRMHF